MQLDMTIDHNDEVSRIPYLMPRFQDLLKKPLRVFDTSNNIVS